MNALQALMVLATATLTLPALALPALAQTALAQTALAQTALAQTALAQTAADQFHPKRGLNFDIWVQWMDTKDMLNTPGFLDIYPDWRTHVSVTAINALPWAEVFVNGERLGETPIGGASLPIGVHEVIFRHPELGERKANAIVTLGAPARLSVDMRAK